MTELLTEEKLTELADNWRDGLTSDEVKALIAGCRRAIELEAELAELRVDVLQVLEDELAEVKRDRDLFDAERVKVVWALTKAEEERAKLAAAWLPYAQPTWTRTREALPDELLDMLDDIALDTTPKTEEGGNG